MEELAAQFPTINPLVLEELLVPTIRPLVDNYDHHLYMVMHFPSFDDARKIVIAHEIDFILTKDSLITVQYDPIPELDEAWHEAEHTDVAHVHWRETPAHLLFYILQNLFVNTLRDLDKIQREIDAIEQDVFAGREKEIFHDIALLKRNVLDFRRTIKPQRLMLESLVQHGTKFYGERTRHYLEELVGAHHKIWDLLENHKETLDALYDTNDSLLASKTNETMRAFTILAFISFIPTAIANIYGMNIAHAPFVDRDNAFWVIITLMLVITAVVYVLLKWRRLI